MTEAEAIRRRIREGLALHRAWEREEAGKALFVVCDSWYVGAAGRKAAEYAVAAAAQELLLPLVPRLVWFRPGGPHDRPTDPGAFRSHPDLAGYVDPARPTVIGLHVGLSHTLAGGPPSPQLLRVVAHEAQHVADLLARPDRRDRGLEELRADITAWRLLHGEPAPFGAPLGTLHTTQREEQQA